MHFEVQGHTISDWKALSGGKYESREQSCGITLNICQDVFKSYNLLHKRGFGDYQMQTTVHMQFIFHFLL